MKTHRFFVDQNLEEPGDITITDQSVIHKMRDVLRLRKGDPVILLDGVGNMLHGQVKVLMKKSSIISKEKMKKVPQDFHSDFVSVKLCSAMIKKDKYEWVLQKCTEIGVSEFQPIISDRTEKLNLNMERADKIVREASEQSERDNLPIVSQPMSLEDVLQNCETLKIAFDGSGEKIEVSQLKSQKELCIFVGPEGGWSEKDIELFKRHDVKIVSLGDRVLRAETASVAVASLLLLG